MNEPMLPQAFRLLSHVAETDDTFTISLKPESGSPEFHFAPGQFNMLYAFGAGEIPISISGDDAGSEACVHTIRAVGPATELVRNLSLDAQVGLRGPFGTPWPLAEAEGRDVLLIAGGIGLAPLRPVIYRVLRRRERFGRLTVLYGTRAPKDVLFREELARWSKLEGVQVEITVDTAEPGWQGHMGVVPKLIPGAEIDPLHAVAMLCGPEIMMRFTVAELEKLGLPEDRIFLSMERNMKCAVGLCGHCQYGADFVCTDGPVFPYDRLRTRLYRKEL